MNCAVDSTKIQQDDGTMRGIEIVPEGCQAVSEDVCSSGYMAPSNNVTFPMNSLKQCCKCKAGEACPLCANPNACTEDEKEQFVTDENCFGDMVLAPSPGPAAQKPSSETDNSTMYTLAGLLLLLLLILAGFFLFSR
jgi:hypothetical protein